MLTAALCPTIAAGSYNTAAAYQVLYYDTYPYYAQSIASIMPGQAWRDTGHKALMPGVRGVCPLGNTRWRFQHVSQACMCH